MTKEEKIKEAYGEYYEDIRLCIDKDGFCELGQKEDNDWGVEPFLNKEELDIVTLDSYSFKYRPKSLQGIEHNNGWIKIESENDLPKEYEFYNACYLDEKHTDDIPMFYGCNLPDLRNYFQEGTITHYQPIENLKTPLY